MSNTSNQLTKSNPLQPTTLMTLQQCTDKKTAFNEIVKSEQSLTIADSLQSFPLIKSQGTKASVIPQIIRVIEFFIEVVGKSLESYQIQVLAGDLYEKFKHDTLEDVIMMFKHARTGDFGKIYDCKPPEILSWCTPYLELKAEEREKLLAKEKRERRNAEDQQEPISEEAKKRFEDLFKQVNMASSPGNLSISKTLAEPLKLQEHIPELYSLDSYLKNLPDNCKELSKKELLEEIKKTEFVNKEAHAILINELNSRTKK